MTERTAVENENGLEVYVCPRCKRNVMEFNICKQCDKCHNEDCCDCRIELKRDIILGELTNCTYKDVWLEQTRPAAELLVSNTRPYSLAAITLLIPVMDRVYTIRHFGYDRATTNARKLQNCYTMKNVVRFFFIPQKSLTDGFLYFGYEHDIKVFTNFLNSLKHDGFIRSGVRVTIDKEKFWETKSYDGVMFSHSPHDRYDLVILPNPFYETIRNRIDRFMETAYIVEI